MVLNDILRWLPQGHLDHLSNFWFHLAVILYFPKGFTVLCFWSKSEICQFQGGERATKTIYQDFDLGLFSSSNFYQRGQPTIHYTMPYSFSCQHENLSSIVWTATVWEWSKSFTYIEHRVGAADHTPHQSMVHNHSDMWRSTIEIGAAELCSVTCRQRPYPVYRVNIASVWYSS